MNYIIYCDGSARNNGYENAVGAWAYIVLDSNGEVVAKNCEAVRGATNQQMELRAAIEALEYVAYNHIAVPFDSVEVITDSAYLHNCYTQKWYRNWQLNGWVNSKKQPVANRELWEKLITWFESPKVLFTKTKGHANDEWNNVVDEMAQKASLAMKEE
jgi:ribonuclease HI